MSSKILFFFFIAAAVSGTALPPQLRRLRPDGRIVGGSQVTIQSNPWQVSLGFFGFHSCGGSIIAPDIILTAAHCVDDGLSFLYEIISGTDNLSSGGTTSSINRTIVHEEYNTLSNDVALIFLSAPLTFDATTQAIKLADEEPAAGDDVAVTGWGILSEEETSTPNNLYGVDLTIVDRKECANAYTDVVGANVDDNMVCAAVPEGGKDSCSGDSGGPLTKNGVQVGIVSWGLGCARAGYPGVYTNVVAVREWIRENAGV